MKYSKLEGGDEFFEEAPKTRSFWGRTFFLGVLHCCAVLAAIGAALLYNLWLALAVAIALPLLFGLMAPALFGCLYRKGDPNEWVGAVRSVVLVGCLIVAAFGLAGGYYARELYAAKFDRSGANVPSDTTPDPSLGVIASFANDAKAMPQLVGRTLVWGMFPVCVAPVLAQFNQRDVGYWAVDSGECCTRQAPDCAGWGAKGGALVLRFREAWLGLEDAVADSETRYSFNPAESRVFVSFGDPANIIERLHFRAAVLSATGAVAALLVMLYQSLRHKY